MSKKVALITGASRGIGRGIALYLAEHGYDIAGAATQADPSNTEKGLYEVKARVEERGQEFLPVTGNLGDLADHDQLVMPVLEHFGHIDTLVNNAGVGPKVRNDILDCTPESFDFVMDINLRGVFFFSQQVAKHMVARREQAGAVPAVTPSIIFISSISADTASTNRVEYCASKAALGMVAQTFAVRLAEHGINVFEVRPGITATDMTAGVQEKYDKLIAEGILLQPRWGQPEDIAKAVYALADGYFDYATGAVIEVGGGFGVKRL